MPDGPTSPWAEIRRLALDAECCDAVEELYTELEAEISARLPVCVNRGACCAFGRFEHRLFVTPVELAYFLARTDAPLRPAGEVDACPYHRQGRCEARAGRPAGCRIFFCDPRSEHWQPQMSERALARLKGLHERFNLPYAYVDWMAALRSAGGGAEV